MAQNYEAGNPYKGCFDLTTLSSVDEDNETLTLKFSTRCIHYGVPLVLQAASAVEASNWFDAIQAEVSRHRGNTSVKRACGSEVEEFQRLVDHCFIPKNT